MGAASSVPREYALEDLEVILGGLTIKGAAPGDFLSIDPDGPQYVKQTGGTGEVSRSRSSSRGGKITFNVMYTSPDNAKFQAIKALDVAANAGVVPILIRDPNGGTVIRAAHAWYEGDPSISFGAEAGMRSYVFDVARLTIVHAGSNPAGITGTVADILGALAT